MSDLGFHVTRTPAVPVVDLFEALARPSGFRADARYGGANPALSTPQPEPEPALPDEDLGPDPLAEAFTQGFAAGHDQASAEAAARTAEDHAAREGLALSFQRLDDVLAEELRQRLRDTVAALCGAALGPFALDEEALLRRIGTAVAMLSRADDERTIRLHPADLALVSPRLAADWTVEADASLERGTVRVDTPGGGVEDGPATWRLAIAEALGKC